MKPFRPSLLLATLCTAALLSACGNKAETAVVAVEIDRATTCELDGMLLSDFPGPKAQIHFKGEDKPSFYCDTVEMFNTLLKPEQVKALRAVLVQDMGKANWDDPVAIGLTPVPAFMYWAASSKAPWGPPLPASHKRQMPRPSLPKMVVVCCVSQR